MSDAEDTNAAHQAYLWVIAGLTVEEAIEERGLNGTQHVLLKKKLSSMKSPPFRMVMNQEATRLLHDIKKCKHNLSERAKLLETAARIEALANGKAGKIDRVVVLETVTLLLRWVRSREEITKEEKLAISQIMREFVTNHTID